ncbi:MAG: hypothetical protein XD63_1587 [Thermoanaerobacterales bacterium 50_218]|nr:MAG: hypothetical protein XD63_1587 [Thermoanaerobacterales bacterium 50_218]
MLRGTVPHEGIKRILFIHDTLYTVSNRLVKACDLDTLKEIKFVELPASVGKVE